ncbi:hypothetical protein BU26DRAFT_33251 [Trematosphaeria pertusa]|uniref:Uncharacterized protein n=1 Tax=Trematosphaeria pertusa TaxID=390896 RepID=A0A6A6J3Q9_9PLEO|nr:uncharacterized protein BU26DRAFT_33251 [Trematosphaeria pertusa]KAF2256987.1 hypothetical protein BU26DRAFT_33251 [Trematosphaeria pertusa]
MCAVRRVAGCQRHSRTRRWRMKVPHDGTRSAALRRQAAHVSPHIARRRRKLPVGGLGAGPCADALASPLPRRQKARVTAGQACAGCNLTRAGDLLAHKHAAASFWTQDRHGARSTWPLGCFLGSGRAPLAEQAAACLSAAPCLLLAADDSVMRGASPDTLFGDRCSRTSPPSPGTLYAILGAFGVPREPAAT